MPTTWRSPCSALEITLRSLMLVLELHPAQAHSYGDGLSLTTLVA